MTKEKGSSFLDGLLFGGALGAALGILFAPQTGDDTRAVIKTKVNEMSENSDQVVQELKDNSEKVLNQTKRAVETGLDNFSYALAEAKKAAQSKREELEKTETPENEKGA